MQLNFFFYEKVWTKNLFAPPSNLYYLLLLGVHDCSHLFSMQNIPFLHFSPEFADGGVNNDFLLAICKLNFQKKEKKS